VLPVAATHPVLKEDPNAIVIVLPGAYPPAIKPAQVKLHPEISCTADKAHIEDIYIIGFYPKPKKCKTHNCY
jgi:hypothetical protein